MFDLRRVLPALEIVILGSKRYQYIGRFGPIPEGNFGRKGGNVESFHPSIQFEWDRI